MITPIRILTALVCFSASAATGTEPLTLSHVAYEETLTVVVDFDPDLHNSVVQGLEHFWKMQGNVQDVTVVSANDLSKRRHLAPGNIVLYGTFAMREDNPVFRAFRGTWIGDLLRKEAPHFSGDVGGLIVGKNPFSPGSSVVVVATSLDLFAQLHEHYDGSKSFIAVVDGRLESVMVYDAEFNGIDPGIDLNLALEDVSFFFRVIEEAHPQPLINLSPEAYIELKRNVKKRLAQVADHRKIVPTSALSIELAKAAAAFKDGHTSVHLDLQQVDFSDTTRRMLPFEMTYELGELYTDHPYERGHCRKIVAIDNRDPIDFLEPVLAAISGEKLQKKLTTFVANQGVYWYFLAPVGEDSIVITTKDRSGQTLANTVDLVTILAYRDSIVSADEERVEDYHMYYHDGETCYYRFDNFRNSDEQRAYADSLFSEISTNNTKNVVIDLRFNGGGNSLYGDYLLDYLTNKPYGMTARMDVKLSEHLYAQHEQFRAFDELTGQTITRRSGTRNPRDRGNRFNGDLYVLIGPRTFSSAASFADIVKDYELGILIGEEVGATRQSFGENLRKTLPHSRLGFIVSCKLFFAPIPRFDDERRGTVPDVPIDEDVFMKYPDSDDPVLSYALDHIVSR